MVEPSANFIGQTEFSQVQWLENYLYSGSNDTVLLPEVSSLQMNLGTEPNVGLSFLKLQFSDPRSEGIPYTI